MKTDLYHLIMRPIISEKSTALSEVGGRYVFQVAVAASKPEIRSAIQSLFGVRVRDIKTMIVPGKTKNVAAKGGRMPLKRSNWKKAIVTLAEGQKIEFFESTQTGHAHTG